MYDGCYICPMILDSTMEVAEITPPNSPIKEMENQPKLLWVGVDVGSTTVKLVIADPGSGKSIHARYLRHNAMQTHTVLALLEEAHLAFPLARFQVVFCGSGGQPFAECTGAFFVQEVVANALAVRQLHPQTRVAIELGGQDAKVIFFQQDPTTGKLIASDMRMNGSCAGGTGAFIDQVAELLNIKTEEFESMAARGRRVYEISGRCGVFAKTDIQPLLNQGVSREDIALSSLHAIAKQTIGGLAQGMEIHPPVLFEGGPLTFNPTLVQVFQQRLNLDAHQSIVPTNSDTLVALGAALAMGSMFAEKPCAYSREKALESLRHFSENRQFCDQQGDAPFFSNFEERQDFHRRHHHVIDQQKMPAPGTLLRCWLGIDAGSTTTKLVLLDDNGELLDSFYAGNGGEPLQVLKKSLLDLRNKFKASNVQLDIQGVGTTGYGEMLFARALKADYHTVETVAHAHAARQIVPDVSFILDIGGQDMKAISVQDGIVSGIILNEACSSGCGSFIETYARSLGIAVGEIAELAFVAKTPSRLGSRCTVFMNSSIITEQRDGKKPADIIGGVCRSIIENVFTKVIRFRNLSALGNKVVVQGGTFKNDAVLRAFEQYTGLFPIRPPHPGEMGAIGIALLTRNRVRFLRKDNPAYKSSFIGLDHLEKFTWAKNPGQICSLCSNSCSRTVVTFSDGSTHVTGNRCERGEITTDPSTPETRKIIQEIQRKMRAVPDLVSKYNRLLLREWEVETLRPSTGKRIGIPRTLEFWSSLPFWRAFFSSLGYTAVISRQSDYELFEEGLHSVPSDTVCFPAKLAHGHVLDLVRKKVDRIFFPMMMSIPSENPHLNAKAVCPVVQGYPMIVDKSDEPLRRHGVPMDHPIFHWVTKELRRSQTEEWFHKNWDIPRKILRRAVLQAEECQDKFCRSLQEEGAEVLRSLEGTENFAVVIGGRPYHNDLLVNHHVAGHFTALGIPVLTLESLPGVNDFDLNMSTRIETLNSFHCRLLSGAHLTSQHPNLELVQIVSFGCGHDAAISDELIRILRERSDRELLVLKLDEGDVRGPLAIRIKSFVETVRARRSRGLKPGKPAQIPFPLRFTKEDRKKRTILVPNLSPGFSHLAAKIFEMQGYKTLAMPLANKRAFELGKKFVHNDICFPAQVNIGEALNWLELNPRPQEEMALGLAKNCENCRAGQYAVLARKALDEAGYERIPVITTGRDNKDMHPGFQADTRFRMKMLWGMAMMDCVEAMVRAIRPYELEPGLAQETYDRYLFPILTDSVVNRPKALSKLTEAIKAFNAIPVDRSRRKPRVAVLGEILMKYHPSANGFVENYLEANGMEVIQPGILDFFRRDELIRAEKVKRGFSARPLKDRLIGGMTEIIYRKAVEKVQNIFAEFKYGEYHTDCYDLVNYIDGFMDRTYTTGEGWLIPAEILKLASQGVNSFVVVQPFGCLANHISGRGLTKALKERFPHIQILSLDYDPDTSFANVENRLQMLIINARELERIQTTVNLSETLS